ncbi:hypothetical protein ACHAXT_008250 [Thalassiosira profunda]
MTADWEDLESEMDSILSWHDGAASAATVQKSLALIDDLANGPDRLLASSRAIASKVNADIDDEKRALSSESEELARGVSRVQTLEEEVAALHSTRADLQAQRREAEAAIPLHAAVADEEVAEADALASRHVRDLPKIKHELSLHAVMTNVKWDYSKTDVLAGEVSIPSRAVHRRFEIPRGELGEYEIAERLWRMIEG